MVGSLKYKILILLGIVLVAATLSWFYFLKPKKELAHLIPNTSLFAFYANDFEATFTKLSEFNWYQQLDASTQLGEISSAFERFASLQKSGVLQSKITELPVVISWHTTSSSTIEPLFLIQSNGFSWKPSSIASIIKMFTDVQQVTVSTQVFNDDEITIFKAGDITLNTFINNQVLAVSTNAVLIEDVIRAANQTESRLIDKVNDLKYGSDALLIFNTKRTNELGRVFFDQSQFVAPESFPDAFLVDVTFMADDIVLKGRGGSQASADVKRGAIVAENLLPIGAYSMVWKPVAFNETYKTATGHLSGNYHSFKIDAYAGSSSKVHVFEAKAPAGLKEQLDAIAESYKPAGDSTIYQENYLNEQIGYVNKSGFLAELTNQSISEDAKVYYTVFQGNALFSANVDVLKSVLAQFDDETTWGKSVIRRGMLEELVQESEFTYLEDFEYTQEPILENLRPKWKTFFNDTPALLNMLDMLNLQLDETNNQFLLSGNLSFRSFEQSRVPAESIAMEGSLPPIAANAFANSSLSTKPFVAKNHNTGLNEVIFQDKEGSLYLVDKDGSILWKKQLPQINGEIRQVDYYNNKKLQYLMFSDSLVHIIDRNGDDLDGFPKLNNLPMAIEGFNVVDYDNSKRYRYLTYNRRGQVFLYNKEADLLDGWNPKVFGGALTRSPFHVRVLGKDAFVAVEKNRSIYLLNRRGETFDGFPVNTNSVFAGDVSFNQGPNFEGSTITVVSDEGQLLTVNLAGKKVQDLQLVKPTAASRFELVEDKLKRDFVIARTDESKLVVLDNKGNEKFEVPGFISEDFELNYYNYRNGRDVYVLFDAETEQCWLYNGKGELLCSAIPASHPVAVLYFQNSNEYEVFVNFANQMSIYKVSR